MTIRWTVSVAPSDEQIASLASLLRGGAVALLPTDTIYGLHAVATHEEAVGRIVALKGRDQDKPLVVLGASREDLAAIGAELPISCRAALDELWPGPLTAIVPLKRPVAASRGASSLGIRVPAVSWLRQLLRATGPLASTSANLSGQPPITDPQELSSDLQNSLDAIVDCGRLSGDPSTIVDFTGDEPRLIRSGESFFTQKVWKRLRKTL